MGLISNLLHLTTETIEIYNVAMPSGAPTSRKRVRQMIGSEVRLSEEIAEQVDLTQWEGLVRQRLGHERP